jgi:hypothetical protein
MVRYLAFTLGIVCFASCYRDNDPHLPPPDAVWGIPPSDASSPCDHACSVLERLGCPEGEPTPEGGSCQATCETNDVVLPVECIGFAHSAVEVRSCGVRCMR